jgi:hypothetical protein
MKRQDVDDHPITALGLGYLKVLGEPDAVSRRKGAARQRRELLPLGRKQLH